LNDMIQLMIALNFIDSDGAIFANKVLSTQTLRELELPLFMNPDTKTGQGTPFQMIYLKNKLARTLVGNILGYSSHIILVPNLRLGIVAMSNTEVDMSQFTTPAAVAFIPVIEAKLNSNTPLPTPPPAPILQYTGVFAAQKQGGGIVPQLFISAANQFGALQAGDSRYPATVFYLLNYVGALTKIPQFQVTWSGDPLALSCLSIEESGAENDFIVFGNYSAPIQQYTSLIFQDLIYIRTS